MNKYLLAIVVCFLVLWCSPSRVVAQVLPATKPDSLMKSVLKKEIQGSKKELDSSTKKLRSKLLKTVAEKKQNIRKFTNRTKDTVSLKNIKTYYQKDSAGIAGFKRPAVFKRNPFQFWLTQQLADRQGAFPVNAPANFTRFMAQGGVEIMGVPLKLHGMASTEQQTNVRQPMNRFGVDLDKAGIRQQLNGKIDEQIALIKNTTYLKDLAQLEKLYKFYDQKKIPFDSEAIKSQVKNKIQQDSLNTSILAYKQQAKDWKNYDKLYEKAKSSKWVRKHTARASDSLTAKLKTSEDSLTKKWGSKKNSLQKLNTLKTKLTKKNVKDLSLADAAGLKINKKKKNKGKKERKSATVFTKELQKHAKKENMSVAGLLRLEQFKDSITTHDPQRLEKYREMLMLRFLKNKDIGEKYKALQKYRRMSLSAIVASKIRGFSIGTAYPAYSKYTLWNVPVTGVHLEAQPFGKTYLCLVTARNLNAIPNRMVYDRNIHGGKVGWGSKEENHIHFTYLKGQDNTASVFGRDTLNLFPLPIDTISVNPTTPRQNQLMGTDIKWKISKKIEFITEWYHAVTAMNTTVGQIAGSDFKWLAAEKPVDDSTQVKAGRAYQASLRLQLTSATRLSLTYEHIGSNYYAMGSPYLRNDLQGFEVKAEQRLLKGQLMLSPMVSRMHDNLLGQKTATTYIYTYGLQARISLAKLPFVVADYRINDMQNKAFSGYYTVVTNLQTGYNYRVGTLNLQTMLAWQRSRNDNNDPGQQALVRDMTLWQLNQVISGKKPLQAAFSLAYLEKQDNKELITQTTGDFSLSYVYMGIWLNNVGYAVSKDSQIGGRTTYYWETGFTFKKYGTLKLRIEKTAMLGKEMMPGYQELLGQITLQGRF
jgi:hypothetical protein